MSYPYTEWNTRKSLGVRRAQDKEIRFFTTLFQSELIDPSEYFDFEKLPLFDRKLAPFALPMAQGGSVYSDSQKTYRFKPAYLKLEDTVDPLMPITKRAGIDESMLEPGVQITPIQRLELIRAVIALSHLQAFDRRLEWLAAKAIIDGKVTLTGKGYPQTLVDFQRDAGHTITLGSGSRFGDVGVSIWDWFEARIDQMANADFGGAPVRVDMAGAVWKVVRKDTEFMKHMDLNTRGAAATVDRGMMPGDRVFKVGEILVGGESGQRIELYVNNEFYKDPTTGATTRYVAANQLVMTGSPQAIDGHQCFGMIVDGDAKYEAQRFFARNWQEGNFPKTEKIGLASAPLMVPVNPNATLSATVLA